MMVSNHNQQFSTEVVADMEANESIDMVIRFQWAHFQDLDAAFSWQFWIPGTLEMDSIFSMFKCATWPTMMVVGILLMSKVILVLNVEKPDTANHEKVILVGYMEKADRAHHENSILVGYMEKADMAHHEVILFGYLDKPDMA